MIEFGKSLLTLTSLGLVCGTLLHTTNQFTTDRIAANEHRAQLAQLRQLAAPLPLPDALQTLWQQDRLRLAANQWLRRTTVQGYGGAMHIALTFSVDAQQQQRLHSVGVIAHAETPGIGDFFSTRRPNWLQQFSGDVTPLGEVSVDAISGATITVNAIIRAVQETSAQSNRWLASGGLEQWSEATDVD